MVKNYALNDRHSQSKYLHCHIQQFLGGASFLMSVVKRKNHCAAGESWRGGWEGTVSPPQWVVSVKPWKILAVLHSE